MVGLPSRAGKHRPNFLAGAEIGVEVLKEELEDQPDHRGPFLCCTLRSHFSNLSSRDRLDMDLISDGRGGVIRHFRGGGIGSARRNGSMPDEHREHHPVLVFYHQSFHGHRSKRFVHDPQLVSFGPADSHSSEHLCCSKGSSIMLTVLEGRTGQPEVKLTLFLIVALAAIADAAGVVAVLPAYILGIAVSSVLATKKDALLKTRVLALAFLTPFFHINAGLNVSLAAVATGSLIIILLFGGKLFAKFIGVFPTAHRFVKKDTAYITLLMSTGLTFGIISAQYGITNGLIDTQQFSILVTVVMMTAIVPTIVAQRWSRSFKDGA